MARKINDLIVDIEGLELYDTKTFSYTYPNGSNNVSITMPLHGINATTHTGVMSNLMVPDRVTASKEYDDVATSGNTDIGYTYNVGFNNSITSQNAVDGTGIVEKTMGEERTQNVAIFDSEKTYKENQSYIKDNGKVYTIFEGSESELTEKDMLMRDIEFNLSDSDVFTETIEAGSDIDDLIAAAGSTGLHFYYPNQTKYIYFVKRTTPDLEGWKIIKANLITRTIVDSSFSVVIPTGNETDWTNVMDTTSFQTVMSLNGGKYMRVPIHNNLDAFTGWYFYFDLGEPFVHQAVWGQDNVIHTLAEFKQRHSISGRIQSFDTANKKMLVHDLSDNLIGEIPYGHLGAGGASKIFFVDGNDLYYFFREWNRNLLGFSVAGVTLKFNIMNLTVEHLQNPLVAYAGKGGRLEYQWDTEPYHAMKVLMFDDTYTYSRWNSNGTSTTIQKLKPSSLELYTTTINGHPVTSDYYDVEKPFVDIFLYQNYHRVERKMIAANTKSEIHVNATGFSYSYYKIYNLTRGEESDNNLPYTSHDATHIGLQNFEVKFFDSSDNEISIPAGGIINDTIAIEFV